MKKLWIFIILIAIVLLSFSAAKIYGIGGSPKISQIIIEPETIVPGDPVFITVDSTSTPVAILLDGKSISTFTYEGKLRAFVPIDFSTKVLEHTVTAQLKNGATLKKIVKVTPREKIEKPLGIPEKLGGNTTTAASNLVTNLAAENYILNTVKTATTTLWTKPFQFPITNVFITDAYGYDRKTVGQTIPHKGTDFRAQIGTEVMAMNRGVVRIARLFEAYGNTVVMDHGLGVQTLYMHMSKLNVKVGDVVEQGTVLGLSGDTGYVEAPHLHISIKINSISIDPMTFMKFFIKKE